MLMRSRHCCGKFLVMAMAKPIDFARSRAILIGTAAYQDRTFLPLPAAANSLAQMREVLTDTGMCGWPAERVTVLADPTDARRLVQTLRRLAHSTDDVLLVYFVGHGQILRRGQLCLVLSDTDAEDSDVTGLEYQWVREALLDSPARVKVVVLDCCYSGRAIETLSMSAEIADTSDTRGVYTLTASDHVAHVLPLEQQATVATSFTGEFLDLIRHGVPDGPEWLTLGTLYLHLRRRLRVRGLPTPNQRGTETADQFFFALNVAYRPRESPLFPSVSANIAVRDSDPANVQAHDPEDVESTASESQFTEQEHPLNARSEDAANQENEFLRSIFVGRRVRTAGVAVVIGAAAAVAVLVPLLSGAGGSGRQAHDGTSHGLSTIHAQIKQALLPAQVLGEGALVDQRATYLTEYPALCYENDKSIRITAGVTENIDDSQDGLSVQDTLTVYENSVTAARSVMDNRQAVGKTGSCSALEGGGIWRFSGKNPGSPPPGCVDAGEFLSVDAIGSSPTGQGVLHGFVDEVQCGRITIEVVVMSNQTHALSWIAAYGYLSGAVNQLELASSSDFFR
jgi:hypothetical protein